MVSHYKYFLAVWMLSFVACNGSDEELFLRADKYCAKEEWSQALDLYNQMKEKGNLVWLKMGNCCYYLKNYTEAFIYWNRAAKNASRAIYMQSKYNQRILMQQLNKEVITHWTESLYEFFASYLTSFSLFFLQLSFLACWFSLFLLRYYKKKRSFFILLILLVNGLIGVAMAVKYKEREKIGIIITDKVDIFAGPNQEYHALATLNHIDQVVIQDKKFDWYKIKHGTCVGWVPIITVQLV